MPFAQNWTENMMTAAVRTDGHGRRSRLQRVATTLATLAALLIVSACTTGSMPSTTVAQANASMTEGYSIGGGDSLKINVFDEPTLTGEYEIGLDGVLSFPLIGMIDVSGMTPEVLSEAISAKLSEGGYVLSPRVAVEVSSHKPFFILGEVNAPRQSRKRADLPRVPTSARSYSCGMVGIRPDGSDSKAVR